MKSSHFRIRKPVIKVVILGVICWVLMACATRGPSVSDDESIVFFPTDAYVDSTGQHWNLPVHGWIYEPENDSKKRQVLLGVVARKLGVEPGDAADTVFRERAAMFLVDNERGEYVGVCAGSVAAELGPSKPNGHFSDTLQLPKDAVATPPGPRWVDIMAVLAPRDPRQFVGRIQMLEPTGVSVISDIDDTIKMSNVPDKQKLLENTFLKPFSPVPGMADVYRKWADKGAAFHYVSASPWQLYPSLQAFVNDANYPQGSIFLRMFRLKDRTFWEFMESSEDYKLATIRGILQSFPERQFILVGDAGERDPEIYGAIARGHPKQISHIYIRDIGRVSDEGPRLSEAFRGVPPERWTLFRDPLSLESQAF